jgi:hypothetical protein
MMSGWLLCSAKDLDIVYPILVERITAIHLEVEMTGGSRLAIAALLAAGGVRDVETLKEQALWSLGGGFRLSQEQTGAPEAA